MTGPAHSTDLAVEPIRDRDLAMRLSALHADMVARGYRAAANAIETAIEQAIVVDQGRHGVPGNPSAYAQGHPAALNE